jgi:hypothetical protein
MTSNSANERDGETRSPQRQERSSETTEGRTEARPGRIGFGSSANGSRSRRNSIYPLQDEALARRHRAGEIQSRLAVVLHSFRTTSRRRPIASKMRQTSHHSVIASFTPLPGRQAFPRLELATLDALEAASELSSDSPC